MTERVSFSASAVGAGTPPTFTRVEPVQTWALAYDRRGWQGGPLVQIGVGEHEGAWYFSTAFQQVSGDCLGHTSPLGFWRDKAGHDTRAGALSAAVAKLRLLMGGRPKELAAHLAWLDTLERPDQPDLFGFAA